MFFMSVLRHAWRLAERIHRLRKPKICKNSYSRQPAIVHAGTSQLLLCTLPVAQGALYSCVANSSGKEKGRARGGCQRDGYQRDLCPRPHSRLLPPPGRAGGMLPLPCPSGQDGCTADMTPTVFSGACRGRRRGEEGGGQGCGLQPSGPPCAQIAQAVQGRERAQARGPCGSP